jgi:hypothetical protein
MKLHGAVGGVLFCFLAGTLGAAGCSSSSSPSGGNGGGNGGGSGGVVESIPGCNQDSTVDCSASGADGWSCPSGTDPTSVDTSVSCSDPTPDGSGNDDYCCFDWTEGDSSCTPDDDITAECSDPSSYGYKCGDPSDDPTSLDSSLNCSAGVADPDGTNTDFCCTYDGTASGSSGGGGSSGGTIPTGCTADSTVDCSGSGADGYSCASGDNPEEEDSTLSCSTPTTDSSGNDDYCCFSWSYGDSTCTPDDDLTSACPDADSYGYQCDDPSDDPTSLDSGLTCSAGVTDPDGTHTDFCCTY